MAVRHSHDGDYAEPETRPRCLVHRSGHHEYSAGTTDLDTCTACERVLSTAADHLATDDYGLLGGVARCEQI